MADQEREKLFDRIMKMYRKAQSLMEMGNEAEAMTFMDGVQKTLKAHNLEMTEVEYAVHQKEQPIKMHTVQVGGANKRGRRRRRTKLVPWQYHQIRACAEAHFCKVIMIDQSDSYLLIGRREDRMVAEFMVELLLDFTERAADKAYTKAFYAMKNAGDVELARGFRKSFVIAFTARIVHRYEELLREMEAESKAAAPGTALVRLNTALSVVRKAADEINQALGSESVETRTGVGKSFNAMGAIAGHEEANRFRLKQTGLASGNGPRSVGPGQKQLGAGK